MHTLSIIIITKNAEDVLNGCLEALNGFGNEVIVVDANSSDKTVKIAKKHKCKIYSQAFLNFAHQRNIAFSYASSEWVLYLDSDEYVTSEFKKEVIEKINANNQTNLGGYFIRRKTFFLGKDWGFIDRVQRLFKKDKFIEWIGIVHETPKINGSYGEILSPILHLTHRNLKHMLEKTNEWSEYEANLRFKVNHPQMTPLRFLRVMITGFIGSYIKEKGYKNGTEGFIESLYQAFSMFITYAKLWEKQKKAKS